MSLVIIEHANWKPIPTTSIFCEHKHNQISITLKCWFQIMHFNWLSMQDMASLPFITSIRFLCSLCAHFLPLNRLSGYLFALKLPQLFWLVRLLKSLLISYDGWMHLNKFSDACRPQNCTCLKRVCPCIHYSIMFILFAWSFELSPIWILS